MPSRFVPTDPNGECGLGQRPLKDPNRRTPKLRLNYTKPNSDGLPFIELPQVLVLPDRCPLLLGWRSVGPVQCGCAKDRHEEVEKGQSLC